MAKPKNYTEMIGRQIGNLVVVDAKVISTSYLICKCQKTGKKIKILPKNFIAKNRDIINSLPTTFSRPERGIDPNKKSNHPLYATYMAMINRCYTPVHISYKYYGGRGIRVCERWLNSFNDFIFDMGDKPTIKHTIDRINTDGDYCPTNCKWSTQKEQMNNQRRNKKIVI